MTTEGRPDDGSFVDAFAARYAVYVHIPFCRRICPYCDFAVVAGGDHAGYVDALIDEVGMAAPFPAPLHAISVGGGTPSSLPAALLGEVLAAIQERFGVVPEAEVGIEVNPEDLDPETIDRLRSAGFGRISLGVQSLDAGVLASLGRAHDPEEGRAALRDARDAFPSVNADLIFGTPGETDAGWQRSLEGVLDTGIDHLSTYALTVERGTALSKAVLAGAPAPDPDTQADRYLAAITAAEDAGLVHYETSNFARSGSACAYNLITWAGGEYEAFGNGAHRHRDGVRSWNVRRVDRYRERVAAGERPVAGSEVRRGWPAEVDRVLVGLRRTAGVVAGVAGNALLAAPGGVRLRSAGVIALEGDRLRVERPLLGDEVSRALLALDPVEC